jgi:hypothetical protein
MTKEGKPMTAKHSTEIEKDTRVTGGIAMTKVTITMPVHLHEELKERAHARNISVTELMRRAVALDQLVNEENAKVYLRDPETGQEQLLRVL